MTSNHDNSYTPTKPANGTMEDGVQLLSFTPSNGNPSPAKRRNGPASEEEKEKLVNSTPVKLDPGMDSLDYRAADISMAETQKPPETPPDRYRMVFIIFLIHGVGILMPWNMFITAKSYFQDYKLNTEESKDSVYRSEFMFYLGIVSQVSNAIISFINTFFQFGGQASTRRIAIALFMMVIIFIFTVILAMIDTSAIPLTFFILTMVSASLLNCCAGVYQNSTFGQAAILPMKYINAIVLGTNLSGIFTSVINVLSIASSPNPRTAAVYYFIVAIVTLLVAFDCYFLLPLTKFYQHHVRSVKDSHPPQKADMKMADYYNGFILSTKTYWTVIKKIWLQLFGVFMTFTVSLILFPAIQSNVRMTRETFTHDNGTNEERTVTFSEDFETKGYWTSIFCFLSFNLFAFLGNLASEWIKWPGPKRVWIPIVGRAVVLIPIYLLCNYKPTGFERYFPVYIHSDIVFIIAGIVMAFTSGYYSSLSMMYGPKEVEPALMGRAGMMMAFFLVLGITAGVNLSLVIGRLVTYPAVS
ncbi:equilibrative nucleoside transporter 1-like [Mya arenaria]|uniref:equilibrative nucleoside transporter 1-like n=1 Tax=Mya arenaria TaxID=6604 RepID=UPI0022E524B0|nr:equilibrative nucleoside transporter 1-like [Mya arenaria]